MTVAGDVSVAAELTAQSMLYTVTAPFTSASCVLSSVLDVLTRRQDE